MLWQRKMRKSILWCAGFNVLNIDIGDDGFEFSESQYEDYAAMYKNVMEELKKPDDNCR